ncbi:MAG: PAS domain-containing protein [Desulfovermiculus sp.]|nr:PAS domain-containing protein [Desulfovermiculus sp.]MDZ7761534.1 PAS domain-containing protein [Desulfovermiculus sp.]
MEQRESILSLAMDCMGVAVTIIDISGVLLYYNEHAAQVLDRKPEYIGENVYSHHFKSSSNNKLTSMLQAFQNGRTEPFHYQATPYGKTILVTLAPLLQDGQCLGYVQSVILKEEIDSVLT